MPNFNTCNGRNLKDLFITDASVLVRKISGELLSWGCNDFGQTGLNVGTATIANPTSLSTTSVTWSSISSNFKTSFALKTDGTLWSWGQNINGQLGDNTTTNRSSPVQTVSAGTNWMKLSSSSSIKCDGSLWTWGQNTYGRLGNNSTSNSSSPIQTLTADTNWRKISSNLHNTGGIRSDGSLWIWGKNDIGQLGDGTSIHKSSPVQTIASGTSWSDLALGLNHTIATKTDGGLWSWGENTNGNLGDNSTINKSSPVQVMCSTIGWKSISSGYYNSGVITKSGSLWIWGKNDIGQLDDGTTISKSSPVQTVTAGTNWKHIEIGKNDIAGTRNDGITNFFADDTTSCAFYCVKKVSLGSDHKTILKIIED